MDKISKEKRSWNMSRIKSKNTKPELAVRKTLYAGGVRYRLHGAPVGKPDIVVRRAKIAIFVNGCFWHQHGCKFSTLPKSNQGFWREKLAKNVKRDRNVLKSLKESGWKTFTIWECQIEDKLRGKGNLLRLRRRVLTFLSASS